MKRLILLLPVAAVMLSSCCPSESYSTGSNVNQGKTAPGEVVKLPPSYQSLVGSAACPVELGDYWIESERKLPAGQFEIFQIVINMMENGRFHIRLLSRVRDVYHYTDHDLLTEYYVDGDWEFGGNSIHLGKAEHFGLIEIFGNAAHPILTLGERFHKVGVPYIVPLVVTKCAPTKSAL